MKFEDDWQALDILKQNFKQDRGVFRKKDPAYQPTKEEWAAIDYLFWEWDYGYEEPPADSLQQH